MIFHIWYGSITIIIAAAIIVNVVGNDETVARVMHNMNTQRKYADETVSTKLITVKLQFKTEKEILRTDTSAERLPMEVTFRTRDSDLGLQIRHDTAIFRFLSSSF
jgi:hypothetical protein